MKKAILLVVAALAIPSVALATKPAHGPNPPKPKPVPQVTYDLRGTLSNYTAYNAQTQTNGSITILVASANNHAKSLKGQTLTFVLDSKSKISLHDGLTTVTNGDMGHVKVRAAKKIAPADLATTLQAQPAKQVVDQGVKK